MRNTSDTKEIMGLTALVWYNPFRNISNEKVGSIRWMITYARLIDWLITCYKIWKNIRSIRDYGTDNIVWSNTGLAFTVHINIIIADDR